MRGSKRRMKTLRRYTGLHNHLRDFKTLFRSLSWLIRGSISRTGRRDDLASPTNGFARQYDVQTTKTNLWAIPRYQRCHAVENRYCDERQVVTCAEAARRSAAALFVLMMVVRTLSRVSDGRRIPCIAKSDTPCPTLGSKYQHHNAIESVSSQYQISHSLLHFNYHYPSPPSFPLHTHPFIVPFIPTLQLSGGPL
jgi:hypothetical protein